MKALVQQKRIATFEVQDLDHLAARLLAWAHQEDRLCLLDSNIANSNHLYPSYDLIFAAGAQSELLCAWQDRHCFDQLREYQTQTQDWLFGYLSYDLKNEVERLTSHNQDGLHFPLLHFFQPRYLFLLQDQQLRIESYDLAPEEIWAALQETPALSPAQVPSQRHQFQTRMPKREYLDKVERIRQHIIAGDVYEMNFCQEFFVENYQLDPASTFLQLQQIAKSPFSAYYRCDDRYLLSASPERFLKKEGQRIVSQPIKGTTARHTDPEADRAQREALRQSEKDQAENVMIVDLVRNDLARTCLPGSVKVEELFGIYPFEQVYQMISTVVGTLRPELDGIEAIRRAFPMGSMTGAPKVMSMKLIEEYERSRRGLYSGALGYFSPEGDFDFNVVIRSLLYNAHQNYLSFQVGGAIVYDSVPEQEYAECLLKAKGLLELLHAEVAED